MKFLKLVLSAPLQSWGENSRWDNRQTETMPAKSGVVGLLGCCLGYPRGDERLRELDKKLHMAVRADKAGTVMTDFQTVQGNSPAGYTENRDDWIILNAEGKKRSVGNTIITPKSYLQNARFTVFLWGEESLLAQCAEALKHPCWAPYLGRKNCVPAVPLLPEWVEAETPDAAVRTFAPHEMPDAETYMNTEIELTGSDEATSGERVFTRRDSVLRADVNEYDLRTVRAGTVKAGGEAACT